MNGATHNLLRVLTAGGLLLLAGAPCLAQSRPTAGAGRINDIAGHAVEADKLIRAGKITEATKKLDLLWRDVKRLDPMLTGGSAAILADTVRTLCRKDPKAREAFRAQRDDAANRFESENGSGTLADLAEWMVLNRALDQSERTMTWWNRIRKEKHAKDVLRRFRCWMEPMLDEAGRLGDMAILIEDPAGTVRTEHAGLMNTLRRDSSETTRQVALKVFHDRNARHYTSLLLAGREADARRLAVEGMRLDHSADLVISLVKEAVEHGRPMKEHVNWLELSAAEDPRGIDLKKRVADAVEKNAPAIPVPNPSAPPAPGGRGGVTTAQVPVPEETPVER